MEHHYNKNLITIHFLGHDLILSVTSDGIEITEPLIRFVFEHVVPRDVYLRDALLDLQGAHLELFELWRTLRRAEHQQRHVRMFIDAIDAELEEMYPQSPCERVLKYIFSIYINWCFRNQ